VILVLAVSGYAHHPFSAEYDWKQPVTLTGTVEKIEWSNPHAVLYINGKDQNGEMKHWTLEMGSPSALTHAGWTRNTVKMGDQVTVDGWMSKTKKDHANVKSVKMADGRETVRRFIDRNTRRKRRTNQFLTKRGVLVEDVFFAGENSPPDIGYLI